MDKQILIVGLTCVDIINYAESFPIEDSDSRVLEQIWSAGGNATNNVVVLNQLNSHSILFSAIPINCSIITSLLTKVGISSKHCVHRLNGDLPTSTVIVNERTGSRTILHYRHLRHICFLISLQGTVARTKLRRISTCFSRY